MKTICAATKHSDATELIIQQTERLCAPFGFVHFAIIYLHHNHELQSGIQLHAFGKIN